MRKNRREFARKKRTDWRFRSWNHLWAAAICPVRPAQASRGNDRLTQSKLREGVLIVDRGFAVETAEHDPLEPGLLRGDVRPHGGDRDPGRQIHGEAVNPGRDRRK